MNDHYNAADDAAAVRRFAADTESETMTGAHHAHSVDQVRRWYDRTRALGDLAYTASLAYDAGKLDLAYLSALAAHRAAAALLEEYGRLVEKTSRHAENVEYEISKKCLARVMVADDYAAELLATIDDADGYARFDRLVIL